MTTNPRDAIERVLGNWLGTGERECGEQILDALCPPGSRVVVDRTPKPCPECDGDGSGTTMDGILYDACSTCGGSGVVEATTIHGLEEVEARFRGWDGGVVWSLAFEPYDEIAEPDAVYRLVALPEETPDE